MMSLLFLVSALILGTAITKRLGLKLYRFETPALAITLGLFLWTWLSLITSLLLPSALSLSLTVLIAGTASLWLLHQGLSWHWQPPLTKPTWILWGCFSSISTAVLAALMWTHDLIARNGGLYSAAATWADFGLHSSLITHIASAQKLPLDSPVAAGTHLTYPFLADLLSAWLVYGSWSLHLAIFVPSILLVMAALQLFLGFGLRTFRSLGGTVLGLALMLTCGSAVGLPVALSNFRQSGQTLWYFLGHLPQDYSILTTPNAQVSNFVSDSLLPQRSFLFGLAVCGAVLVLIAHLRHTPNRRLAVFTGLLMGLLPLGHAHTFVVLMAITGSLYIQATIKQHRLHNLWFYALTTALATATPQIIWQFLSNGSGTGGHWSPGWTIQPGESLTLFWLHNYGLTLALTITVLLALVTIKNLRQYLVFYLPVCAIFISANLYSLQPFAYDNLKLIYYVYVFTYLFTGYGAIWLIRRWRPAILPVVVILIVLSTSGLLSIVREFQHQDQFASADDIALAGWAERATPTSTVFVTTDRPNQPLATLAGRSIILGYRGWLYNFNLNYEPRVEAVQAALNGQLTTANDYHATYVVIATTEPADWTVDQAAVTARYRLVYANPSWSVYELPNQ